MPDFPLFKGLPAYFSPLNCQRREYKNNQKTQNAITMILTSFTILLATVPLLYKNIASGITDSRLIVGPFCPATVIASVLIFSGFANVKITKDISKLSERTFRIYLLHAGILDFTLKTIKHFIFRNSDVYLEYLNPIIFIPIFIISTFTISLLLANLCKTIGNKIDKKINVTGMLIHLFKIDELTSNT